MTLRPIPGAPVGSAIPDFPTDTPDTPAQAAQPVEPEPSPLPPEAALPSPVDLMEIPGSGGTALRFRAFPEIPAITRSSMTISMTGERAEDYAPGMAPQISLPTDQAKAFLLALRDGSSPIVVADSGNGFQVEFVVTADGPAFVVGTSGQGSTLRRFNAGQSRDVSLMATQLLAVLGP